MAEKYHNEDYYIKVLFEKIKIKEIMNKNFVLINEGEDCSKAQRLFLRHNVSHLMVVDSKDNLVGIISQKYLYKARSPRKILGGEDIEYDPNIIIDGDSFYEKDILDDYVLSKIMLEDPLVLKPDDQVSLAIKSMKRKNLSCIPVVNKDNVVEGVLTDKEIVNYISQIISDETNLS